MFIRMPEVISIVAGMPIHRFTTITVHRAQVALVRKGRASVVKPQFWSSTLMMPFLPSMVLITSREMKEGMAMASTNTVRHTFFSLIRLELMRMARNIPPK